jgi:hypothetical protein
MGVGVWECCGLEAWDSVVGTDMAFGRGTIATVHPMLAVAYCEMTACFLWQPA